MADGEDPAPAAGDEVKPYRIRVSSRYLDLTKQKLELTRLPHEVSDPKADDWWEPKPQVEPLIDFWLEKYSWRDQETTFNNLPQFRTAISVPFSETPLRIHFVHVRSAHAHAVPLLLIPSFPITNLSFSHLIEPLSQPEDAANDQPFHLVIPSLPGLGFSDPFPNNAPVIPTTADMLNTLMSRLSYPHYLATNSGAASSSPAEIDWRLADYLAMHYSTSCIGTHLISPPLLSPKINQDPWEWTKWQLASLFQASMLGYSGDDFSALDRLGTAKLAKSGRPKRKPMTPTQLGLNKFGLREPNTLAYALCDSPTGLLVFVLKGLRFSDPRLRFAPEQIINFTQLAWLPGPEYAMRFWAHCAAHNDEEEKRKDGEQKESKIATVKPRVAITVFLGGKSGGSGGTVEEAAADDDIPQPPMSKEEEEEGGRYVCPAWGNARYDVMFSQRTPGRPGMLAWERPEVIAAGVRGLAKEILRVDSRLKPAPEPATDPLEQVVVSRATDEPNEAPTNEAPKGDKLQQGGSAVSPDLLRPPPPVWKGSGGSSPLSEGESPDTLVNTPPLGATPLGATPTP